MDDLLRWLASLRGINPGTGVELQFEFANFPTGGLGMLVLMGLALAVGCVAVVYRMDGRSLSTAQRVLLGALRAIAVLAIALLLLEPNVVGVERETRPGHTILLIDTSQSMAHVDAYRRDAVQPQVAGWQQLGLAPGGVPRLELVKALLRHGDGELLAKLGARNQVQAYSFAANIAELPRLPAAGDRPQLDVERIAADGRATNIGAALRAALDKSRPAEIAAVVLISDGRRNSGPQGAEVARLLAQRRIPHTFVLGVGDPSATQSVAVVRVDAPAKVFQRDPFEVRADLAASGHDQMPVTVRLVQVDEQGGEQVVRTQVVELGGDTAEVRVAWSDLAAEAAGRRTYRVELVPPDGEPMVPERHARVASVEVLGERLRVLLLAGGASHEYQILRNLLTRDKTIEVSCWLQSADPKFPQDGDPDVRIDRLPQERSEFDPYDVVVLVDPDRERLTARFCEHLAQHVVEGGCGLWWVAGEKHTLDAMRPGASTRPLAELLPIEADVEFAERQVIGFGKAFPRPWPYALTRDGETGIGQRITRIADGLDESRIVWGRLPGYHFWFPVARLKPAAIALVEHTSPELRRGGAGMPLIALQGVGAGRALFSGTDETYRWRSTFETAYDRFWVSGIRYLFEGRLLAGNSRLRLLASTDQLDLGESIEIQAEVRNEALQPLVAESFAVGIERDGATEEVWSLSPIEGAPGSFSGRYRPTRTGAFRVRPIEKIGRDVEIRFQVDAAQLEREGPMDRAELAAIAAVPGGELFDLPSDLLAAANRIPSRTAIDVYRTPHALWDGWATIAFVLTVLALEWLLRKRFNLL